MRYLKRIVYTLYYLANVGRFRYLSFKSIVYPTVRVQGGKFISIHGRTVVQRYGWLLAYKIDDVAPEIIIGNGCAIGDFCHITAVRRLEIEDDVLIANNVYISDNAHDFRDVTIPVIRQPVIHKGNVRIQSGTWIGENVCVIGASIGKNCVIGANSVVNKDIPDYSVAVGAPARVIKKFDFTTNSWISVR